MHVYAHRAVYVVFIRPVKGPCLTDLKRVIFVACGAKEYLPTDTCISYVSCPKRFDIEVGYRLGPLE